MAWKTELSARLIRHASIQTVSTSTNVSSFERPDSCNAPSSNSPPPPSPPPTLNSIAYSPSPLHNPTTHQPADPKPALLNNEDLQSFCGGCSKALAGLGPWRCCRTPCIMIPTAPFGSGNHMSGEVPKSGSPWRHA
ncbi:hypothetical protein EJ03DRAFT_212754 [Teratosphaeria nubilosa]|uniref:Uncharacterized protein n=1 Tax=Teratosphaeria nubilosa TaxID=161662 RepID=A0A6G1LHJ5_9PEZI|nr:hypothetical protein EJ03DRAFT_212754 [Teratosphaeria nubilosa]